MSSIYYSYLIESKNFDFGFDFNFEKGNEGISIDFFLFSERFIYCNSSIKFLFIIS